MLTWTDTYTFAMILAFPFAFLVRWWALRHTYESPKDWWDEPHPSSILFLVAIVVGLVAVGASIITIFESPDASVVTRQRLQKEYPNRVIVSVTGDKVQFVNEESVLICDATWAARGDDLYMFDEECRSYERRPTDPPG